MTKWYHVECIPYPTKLKKEGVTHEIFVADILQDDTDDQILSNEEESAKVVEKLKKKAASGAGDKQATGGAIGNIDVIKSNFDKLQKEKEKECDIERDVDESRPSKKIKMAAKMSGPDRAKAEAYGNYNHMNIDQLKDILRWNHQMLAGSKAVLLSRIIDGHINGRLGLCITCGQGRLKLEEDLSAVICPGFYNEDLGGRETCISKMAIEQAPRINPWHTIEPSDAEKEEMETAIEEAKNPTSVQNENTKGIKKKLIKAVENIQWDLESKSGMQKAASGMLEVFSETACIDLPDDTRKARMGIGKLIVANKRMSVLEVLDLVIEQYGFKEMNEEVSKKKTEAIGSACLNKANTNALEALLELGGMYLKEGNFNASNTYKKVVEAVKNLDFAITEENALGLGKNKTKVAGIGKGSAEKLYEFVTTGIIQKLEDKRASAS